MENWSNERKRQHVLEQVLVNEIGVVRRLFMETRWKHEDEDGSLPDTIPSEIYQTEMHELETKILKRLDSLLKSVIATYSKE